MIGNGHKFKIGLQWQLIKDIAATSTTVYNIGISPFITEHQLQSSQPYNGEKYRLCKQPISFHWKKLHRNCESLVPTAACVRSYYCECSWYAKKKMLKLKKKKKISKKKKKSQNTTIKSVITVNVCGAQEGRWHNRTITSERKSKNSTIK